jgi:hypothetical protein
MKLLKKWQELGELILEPIVATETGNMDTHTGEEPNRN